MLNGATLSALAMAGTAVLRIVVSSDSMKNATATSHGSSRLLDSCNFLFYRHVQQHEPILDGLQGETDKNEPNAEGSHAALRKVVGEILDERTDHDPDGRNNSRNQ